MSTTVKLKKGLDRKIWQQMTPTPLANAAGHFMISSPTGYDKVALLIASASVHYLYNHLEDAWLTLPASGIAGTFAVGACGAFHQNGPTGTATAGTTTTITTNLTIPRSLAGSVIRITAGPNAGEERKILSNTIGANSVITVDTAFGTAITASSQYLLLTGRFYFFNAGTVAVGLKYYDRATNTWSAALSVTGLPTAWGTDGKLVAPYAFRRREKELNAVSATATTLVSPDTYSTDQHKLRIVRIISGTGIGQERTITSHTADTLTVDTAWSVTPDTTSVFVIEGNVSGMASSATGTTLVHTGKTWTVNQWAKSQVRIVEGTGVGQVRNITSNTADTLTVPAWGTNPDATSRYVIEPSDDYMFLMGNNAVTLYQYQISANTWSTLTPGVARAGAAATGFSANIPTNITNKIWLNENAYLNGRLIYSFRGGATATLDYYDIALNTWTNGLVYGNQTETFTSGSSYDVDGDNIYIIKEATGRAFRFNVPMNLLDPFSTLLYPQGAATVGDKLWTWSFIDGATEIKYIYNITHTSTAVNRVQII